MLRAYYYTLYAYNMYIVIHLVHPISRVEAALRKFRAGVPLAFLVSGKNSFRMQDSRARDLRF